MSLVSRHPLFVRKGFVAYQNCLFVIIPLLVVLEKCCVIDFFLSDTHLFCCFL